MRILILSNRDITNPDGGSVEVLIHEIAKRWVVWGHSVIWFCLRFPNASDEEEVHGIHIVRRGSTLNKSISAYLYYRKHLKDSVDVIIDATDRLPFFAKLYEPKKTILLTSEIVGKRASNLYPFPISTYWKVLEAFSLLIYQNSPTFVLAPSVKKEIVKRGSPSEYITILSRGVYMPDSFVVPPRETEPTFIYLGKVNKQKGAEDMLEVFKTIRKTFQNARLWYVGAGKDKYIRYLRGLVEKYKFGKSVSFFGFVSDDMKFELLSRAHILMIPSKYEAWGLTIPEAGIVGTPTITYASAGLADLIEQGKSGFVVHPEPDQMASVAVQTLQNLQIYQTMQQTAKAKAQQYSWDKTAKTALVVIEHIYSSQQKAPTMS